MGDYHSDSHANFTGEIAANISRVLADRLSYQPAIAYMPRTSGMNVALTVGAAVLIVFTIVGNQSVLLAFWVSRRIRKLSNYFLASLAASDLFIGVFSMPLFLQYLYLDTWELGHWICDVWLTLDWTVCMTSQFTVFLITTDRFLFLRIPGKYGEWRTERKVWACIAVTWVLPLAIFSVSIIGWPFFVPEGRMVADATCYVLFMDDSVYTLMWTFAYYWIPLVVMCVQYGFIYGTVLKLRRPTVRVPREQQTSVSVTRGMTTFSNTASLNLRTQLFQKSVRWGNNRLVPSEKSRSGTTGNDVNGERAQSSSMRTMHSHAEAVVIEMAEDGERRLPPPVTSTRASLLTPTLETVEANTAADRVEDSLSDTEESSSVCEATTFACKARCTDVESCGLKFDDAAPSVDSRTNIRELQCDGSPSVDSRTNKRELKCNGPPSPLDSITNKGDTRVSVGRRLRNTAATWSQNCVKCLRVQRRGEQTSRAQRALRRITLIVGAFVLCWTPYHVMAITIATHGYDVINGSLYTFTYWLCYLNSTINPFCYALLNDEFKRTLIRILKLDWHRS